MRVIGGFGSAGAGNRSGRRTANNGGISSTYAERNRRVERLASAVDVSLTPPLEELRATIVDGQCWWCKRDGFRALSGHWVRAHGINMQWIRDYLCVPKGHSFVSDETRRLFSENGKRNYGAHLRPASGAKRQLSRFGIESQRRKSAERIARLGVTEALRRFREAAAKHSASSRKTHVCRICGATFFKNRPGTPRVTCSDECDRERRRIAAAASGFGVAIRPSIAPAPLSE